jgi:hypothetical protein
MLNKSFAPTLLKNLISTFSVARLFHPLKVTFAEHLVQLILVGGLRLLNSSSVMSTYSILMSKCWPGEIEYLLFNTLF